MLLWGIVDFRLDGPHHHELMTETLAVQNSLANMVSIMLKYGYINH